MNSYKQLLTDGCQLETVKLTPVPIQWSVTFIIWQVIRYSKAVFDDVIN